jgi:hypothetical protein
MAVASDSAALRTISRAGATALAVVRTIHGVGANRSKMVRAYLRADRAPPENG